MFSYGKILKDMKLKASPGPDGFNVEFYLATWDWIGEEVTQLVTNFYQTATLPSHINNTNIALIPKKLVPLLPTDYRPISLCNVIYKIIAKSLANRLKSHLPDYIDPAQQAFIQGRRISDNIIIAQEIAHSFSLKSWNHSAFMLKIDLAKAFDRLEWNFIVSALTRKGLHGHFINLIHACISSPTFSVLINGQPSQKFKSSRGIRQGCPMSPYLFVLAINELSIMLNEALRANHLQGISLGPNCPSVHSLLFADDLLVCGQATCQEAQAMANLIHHFCASSGQTPNWNKSAILFSSHVPQQVMDDIKIIFPVATLDNNFTHLGHPLILPANNRATAYNFVLDKFLNKLPSYKANMLSHAARLELIRSVFSAIPVYYMSNILFPKKIIAKLTAVIRNFWWTGIRETDSRKSLCLRAWKDISNSKSEGGLGIRNLKAINESLILAAAWRLANNPSSHLYSVLRAKYFPNATIWKATPAPPKSAFWASILKMFPNIKNHAFYQLTQGNITLWSMPWCTHWNTIHDYLIPQHSGFVDPSLVRDLWMADNKTWNHQLIFQLFREPLASHIINTDIIQDDNDDLLCWPLAPNGSCSPKSAYKICLQNIHAHPRTTPSQVSADLKNFLNMVWKHKSLLPKIKMFAWRLLSKALPTGMRAGRFSNHIPQICSRCTQQEDDFHLFFLCHFARAAWFAHPWYIRSDALVHSQDSLITTITSLMGSHHPHASFQNIFNFLWTLWKARNDCLFERWKGHPNRIHVMAASMDCAMQVEALLSSDDQHSVTNNLHNEQQIPMQGKSIQSDLIIKGPKIYSDAAFRT
uniref:Reverse transcriptase domain-containing protein n=1 Tax=Aegilops tauschii subsp. strangulata TaxID=200361 RepID=A0A453D719_AEGTS